ncbi:MAG: hypothetical protein HOB82_06610 [Alphaproteobacteria bacterium]|jgi:hypothetical protein|nr:hypothetical protein [Alphaproteobacteria bacterium]MBT4711182.1 hypothetical protein [Alphaproteobacteria bacterium]MBT5860242.1 hypothetical protein [Alphaproteobacteria bacterium]
MPDTREILASIQGAYLLARFDASGMNFFNISNDGFWRSFGAAVVIAPVVLVTMLAFYAGSDINPLRIAVVEFGQYVAGWAVFPVVMIFVARSMNLTDRYVGYIIAYNWSSVIQVALFAPLNLALSYSGASWLLEFMWLSAMVFVIIYLIFIAKTALGTTLSIAISLVGLDLLLTLVIILGTSDLL